MGETSQKQILEQLFSFFPDAAGEQNLPNLMHEIAEMRRVQDLLFTSNTKIAGEKNLPKLVMLVADLARDIVGAERCTLWLRDEDSHELYSYVAHGVKELRMPEDKGFAGEAVRTGLPIIIPDAYLDHRFNPEMDRQTGFHTKAMIVIPIRTADGRILGAFQAINRIGDHDDFTTKDLVHLSLTATYSGKALESAMLYEEVENTQLDSIFMLGELAESRSRETGYHVKRVAEYCKIIGSYLKLSEQDIELLYRASPMHDAGKVATPDMILKKPGRLTEEEFTIMKRHAEEGYRVLSRSLKKIFKAAAEIAWTHHEKWNGSGYPRGLANTDIPLFGRIVAVADVFDALSNDRCYKKAWSIEKVTQLFQEERGKHFDPDLVDILIAHMAEFVQINYQYRDEFTGDESGH